MNDGWWCIDIEVFYKSKKVEKQCTQLKKATRVFGSKVAIKLLALINLIKCAENLQDVNALKKYHLHMLESDRKGSYALDIDGRKHAYRLIIIPVIDDKKIGSDKNKLTTFYRSICVVKVEEVSKRYE